MPWCFFCNHKHYKVTPIVQNMLLVDQGSTSPLARSPEPSKTGAGLVNFARSVVRGLVEIF